MAQLRLATASDIPGIMRLEQAGFAPQIQEAEATFTERLLACDGANWVLDDGEQLLGYLCAEFWRYQPVLDAASFARDHSALATHAAGGEEVYISSMVVAPSTRGTGAGRRLFSEALAAMFAQQPQLRSAVLIVHPEWAAARRIYQAEGFAETGTVPDYFAREDGSRLPAIIMRRAAAR